MEAHPINTIIKAVDIDPIRRQQPVTLRGVTRLAPKEPAPAKDGVDGVQDQIARQNLVEKLMNMPEIRPEMVERGKQLAMDPNYPPEEVVNKLAEKLASMPIDWLDDTIEDLELPGDA